MRTNYVANAGVRFNVFSQDQLEELFNGVLHLLQYTGLDVKHEEARDILKKAGAWVDGERVRLPSYMVKDALRKAPRSFTLWARDGNPKHNINIGPGRSALWPRPHLHALHRPGDHGAAALHQSRRAAGGSPGGCPAQHRLLRVVGHGGRRAFRPGRALRVCRDVPQHQQADRGLVV